MKRRNSSMTRQRRRKILRAIEEDPSGTSAKLSRGDSLNSLVAPSMDSTDLESEINKLMINDAKNTAEHQHDDHSDSRVIDEDIASPQAKRKCYRRHMAPPEMSATFNIEVADPEKESVEVVAKDPRIPCEVERFLADALGDELNTTEEGLVDTSGIQFKDSSHFTTNTSFSERIKPVFRKMSRLWSQRDDSINEEELKGARDSSTLDRSVKLYRTLSQRIKKKIRAALIREKSPDSPPPAPLRPPSYSKDRMDQMEEILKNMKIQQCTIEQASKALSLCQTSKNFTGSSEEVESERLLLLAVIRKRMLQEELKRLSNTEVNESLESKESSDLTEWAEVTIESINLSLREFLMKESFTEPVEWFLVVVTEGSNIWASSPVAQPIGSMLLEFSNFITTIDKLKPNFKISIDIYSLNVKAGQPDDDRSQMNATLNRTWTYLSPAKLLKRMDKSSRIPRNEIRSPSFRKCGRLELGLRDLMLSSPWTLTAVPHGSILRGIVDLNLSCKLHLSDCHQGLVNYGEEVHGFLAWNTRWCVLKGCTLMFWNYPRDQETKPPIKSIDLMQCCSTTSEVSRELCAKPRTIVVETVRLRLPEDADGGLIKCRNGHTFQRHLLSFHSKSDVIEWKGKLNKVVTALRDWNVKFMKNYQKSTMVSEL